MDDTLIYYGGSVKALGGGKVGGYLVLFTTADDPDIEREFFTKSTDFFLEDSPRALVIYDHGLDPTLKARRLGRGEMRIDDVGVWLEAQLALRDDYEKAIYAMAEAGKLGWSSGSIPHLVDRVRVKKSVEIKAWPIGEASLTPTPTEPRAAAFTLKSYREAKASDLFTNLIEGMAPAALPFADHAASVLAAVQSVVTRAESIQELRIKSGRVLSAANRERLMTLHGQMMTVAEHIKEMLDSTEMKPESGADEMMSKSADPALLYSLLAQFEQHKHARRRAGR